MVVITGAAVAPLPQNRPQAWWFTLPASWSDSTLGVHLLTDAFYTGLVLLTSAWLVVGVGVRAGGWRVRGLWVVAAIWATPLLIGPVALSTDLYTYLGQGMVAHAGLNPYQHGPGAVGLPAMVSHRMPGVWLTTPSPYGPAFMGIVSVIAPLARTHLMYALIAMRLVEALGLLLLGCSLPRLARAVGCDPVRATWLGVASPLVIGSFILSGHNDALMLALLVAGLAVATVERRIAGLPPHVFAIALCALAAMVKAPAAAGVVFLAISWARRQPTFRAGAARLTVSALVAGAVVAAVSLATGVGWSWLNPEALTSPDLATTPFTPVTSLTYTTAWVAHAFGIAIPIGKIMAALQPAGMVVAGTFALALLWRQHRIGLTRALALTLLAVVLASPVTWPWYLSWGVVLLAAAMPARRVLGPIVLATIPLLLIQPDGIPHPFTRAATVGFAIGSLALLLYASYWSYRHLVKSPPPAPVGSTA